MHNIEAVTGKTLVCNYCFHPLTVAHFSSEPCPWELYSFDSPCCTCRTIPLARNMLNRGSISLAVCSLHISQGLKETLKTNIILRFPFIRKKTKKRLQNFGEIVNQQLQFYIYI